MPQTSQKTPHPIDKHVGSRIRMRRALLGMTQQRLADLLSLTFQQVQKYEKGTNRVSASRLQQIATLLGVEVGFFYEGASLSPGKTGATDPHFLRLNEITSSSEGVLLINSFVRIADLSVRRRIAELVASLAETATEQVQPQKPRGRPRKAG